MPENVPPDLSDLLLGLFYISSLLVALPIAIVGTLIILSLFRTRVVRLMRSSAGERTAPATALPPMGTGAVEREVEIRLLAATSESSRAAGRIPLLAAARRSARRTAAIYLLTACALPAVIAALTVVHQKLGPPHGGVVAAIVGFFFFFLPSATPAVLAAITVLKGQLRWMSLGALLLVALLYAIDRTVSTPYSVSLWLLTSLAPTVAVLVLGTRRLRAVGPSIYGATAILVFVALGGHLWAAQALLSGAGAQWESLRRLSDELYGSQGPESLEKLMAFLKAPSKFVQMDNPEGIGTLGIVVFVAISVAALLLGAAAAWGLLSWLAYRYRTRRASELMLRVDVLMIIFAILMTAGLIPAFGWLAAWAPIGFAVYWLSTRSLLKREVRTAIQRPRSLLLLRVFGFASRTQALLDDLDRRWRHLGPVHLIAGADSAYSTVEPHEFFDFLNGRLDRSFIESETDLDARLAELEATPDPDGRFRLHDFFCREHTWRMTVSALARGSDSALMDLRGFTSANRGCIFEIEQLLAAVALRDIVLLIDETTDLEFLRHTLQDAWRRVASERGPADPGGEALRILQASSHRRRTVDSLMGLLCEGA